MFFFIGFITLLIYLNQKPNLAIFLRRWEGVCMSLIGTGPKLFWFNPISQPSVRETIILCGYLVLNFKGKRPYVWRKQWDLDWISNKKRYNIWRKPKHCYEISWNKIFVFKEFYLKNIETFENILNYNG